MFDFSNGLSEEMLAKIRRHSAGTEDKSTRALNCHYCEHKTIIVYEDSQGHVQAKCKKCGCEAVYNLVLRRSGVVMYRRVRALAY
jgi:ribosomal protein S27E